MNNVTTFDNFPPFATNGSRNMNTESAKYAVGFLEGETFPAEWANYLFHGATKGVSDLNTAVQSIWKENINVIQGSGQTPSSSDNTQLKTAIELMIQNAVLTANAQVLAQAKLDAHPVGSLYWSTDPTEPSILFGGTWTQIKDKFIWAKGDSDTWNATGGSKTVQLTESNLPAHTHAFSGITGPVSKSGTRWEHNHAMTLPIYGGDYFSEYVNDARFCGDDYRRDTKQTTGYTNIVNLQHTHPFTGRTDGGAGIATDFSVMPPYIVKYCWERIS